MNKMSNPFSPAIDKIIADVLKANPDDAYPPQVMKSDHTGQLLKLTSYSLEGCQARINDKIAEYGSRCEVDQKPRFDRARELQQMPHWVAWVVIRPEPNPLESLKKVWGWALAVSLAVIAVAGIASAAVESLERQSSTAEARK